MSVEELVKRLRHSDEYEPLGHDGWEAADKLEELAAENKRLNLDSLKVGDQMLAEKFRADKAETALAEAKRENEALREALMLIDALDPEEHVYGCSADALRGLVSQMGRLARNAGGKDAE